MVQRRLSGSGLVLYCALLLLLNGHHACEAVANRQELGRRGLLRCGLFASCSPASVGHSRRGLRQAGIRLFASGSGVSTGESVLVTSGSELVAGLMNSNVTTLLLQGGPRTPKPADTPLWMSQSHACSSRDTAPRRAACACLHFCGPFVHTQLHGTGRANAATGTACLAYIRGTNSASVNAVAGLVKLDSADLQQAGGTVVLQGGRVVNITSGMRSIRLQSPDSTHFLVFDCSSRWHLTMRACTLQKTPTLRRRWISAA